MWEIHLPNTANALRQFLSPILASELAKIEVGGTETNAQLVCRALVKKAKTGDTAACKMIFDLLEDTAKNTKSFLRKPPPLYIPDNLEELSPAELQDLYLQTV
jgi:hypothetical protein